MPSHHISYSSLHPINAQLSHLNSPSTYLSQFTRVNTSDFYIPIYSEFTHTLPLSLVSNPHPNPLHFSLSPSSSTTTRHVLLPRTFHTLPIPFNTQIHSTAFYHQTFSQ